MMLSPWILQSLEDARQADLRRAAARHREAVTRRRRVVTLSPGWLFRLRRVTLRLAR